MGRVSHQLRQALGRGFDKPPDWSTLCPPFQQELCFISFTSYSSTDFRPSHEDTAKDIIAKFLTVFEVPPSQECGVILRSGSSAELLSDEQYPLSLADARRAAGKPAELLIVNDVHRWSDKAIPDGPLALPAPQYSLNERSNLDTSRHSMAHNRTYDLKGRPTTASGQLSRREVEEELLAAQNSVLVTGARRLGKDGKP